MSNSEAPSRRLEGIDGLRGVLILYVMLHHFKFFMGEHYAFSAAHHFVNAGYLSVPCFFAISGFLLFRQMDHRRTESDAGLRFYIRRFFRIMPLWWLTVLFYWIVFRPSFGVALSNLSFTFGFLMFDQRYLPIPQAWSLFVEEVFYAFFPLIFLGIRNLERAVTYFSLFAALSVCWLKNAKNLGIPTSNSFVEFFPLANFHFFLIGITVFYLIQKGSWKKFESALSGAWLINVASGLTVLGLFAENAQQWTSLGVFVVLLATFCEGSLLERMLKFKLLRNFGVRCYPLYLIHFAVIYWLIKPLLAILSFLGLDEAATEIRLLIGFPVFSFVCLAVSQLLHSWIELPAIAFASRILNNTPEFAWLARLRVGTDKGNA